MTAVAKAAATPQVRLHNDLVEAMKGNFTLHEQRLFFYICAYLIKEGDTKLTVPYQIPVTHYAEMFGITDGGALRKELETVAKSLTSKNFRLPLNPDSSDSEDFEYLAWAYRATYKKARGTLDIYMPSELEPFLIGLREFFTAAGLPDLSVFRCKYSAWMFLFVVKNFRLKKRRLTVERLGEILGIEDDTYPRWRDRRRYIIDKAEAELRENATFYFSYNEIRQGRAVTHVDIHFHANGQSEAKIGTEEQLTLSVGRSDLAARLKKVGFAKSKVEEIEMAHDAEYLEWCLTSFDERAEAKKKSGGKIGVKTRYFETILKESIEEYREWKAERDEVDRERTERLRSKRVEQLKAIDSYLKAEHHEFIDEMAIERFEKLPKSVRQGIEEEFDERMLDPKQADLFDDGGDDFALTQDAYRKHGFTLKVSLKTSLVRREVLAFLRQKWDLDQAYTLETYRVEQSYRTIEDDEQGVVLMKEGERVDFEVLI